MATNYSNSDRKFLKNIGARIREIRKKIDLSQEGLSFKAKLDRTYIGGVERGERNISVINLRKIAEALEIDIPKLFSENGK